MPGILLQFIVNLQTTRWTWTWRYLAFTNWQILFKQPISLITHLYPVYLTGHTLIFTNYIYRVSQKKKISECKCKCISFTIHLIWNLEYSFLNHLKIDYYMFAPSTRQVLIYIRELRNMFSIIKFVRL